MPEELRGLSLHSKRDGVECSGEAGYLIRALQDALDLDDVSEMFQAERTSWTEEEKVM